MPPFPGFFSSMRGLSGFRAVAVALDAQRNKNSSPMHNRRDAKKTALQEKPGEPVPESAGTPFRVPLTVDALFDTIRQSDQFLSSHPFRLQRLVASLPCKY